MNYTFTGTYTGVAGSAMLSGGYYSMGGGKLIQANDASSNLNPFRWYMKMEARDGQVILPPNSVKVFVWNEDDDEETSIVSLDNDKQNAPTYTLSGTRTHSANRPGIYIKNGKKFVVK